MSTYTLPKTYDFRLTEERIYRWWEENGYFQPSNDPNKPGFDAVKKPFVISIPPPNVTGELHLGHAMFVSMEDLMIRYHRMKGIPALWVPGVDHAGIATQLQVEKMLESEGTSREAVGREEFLRRTWAWKAKYGGIITAQIRRLGASVDWSRERFTLDEGLSRAVREAFVRLFEKGLVYRGARLVNWAPRLKTAVSDLEVEYSEEPGTLYYFKYMLAGGQGSGKAEEQEYLPVATTRPETILGDTAVAVHPDDPRYQQYIGRKVIVPILGRQIPVIADAYVDREFGGGALKVTPGHDANDYAIAQRHGLPMISVLDEAARVNENGGRYKGQDRFECRKNLWADMRAAGLVIKEELYTLNVPRSERGGEIVEPMISTQWFVKIQPLAEAAMAAVRDGRIRIVPERFAKVYFNWLENIEDWCISRQLWWGHRIPVWHCTDCGQMTCTRTDPTACAHCGSARIEQDPDVLDTWFSSGLWPFSTLGWPEETPDLRYFYPTSIMETGYDILFFWVARMIMMGLEFTGEIPFHTVYLHGLIRDEYGLKMSKSKGNVVDPLVVIDEFGTDALRFTLLVGSTPGNDVNLSLKKVEGNRNFANKIWNASRFTISALLTPNLLTPNLLTYSLSDRWIHARLRALVREVERLFQNYQYGEAGRQIYEFFWGDFADWYVEIAKLQMADGGWQMADSGGQMANGGGRDKAVTTVQTLVHVLDTSLRLLHPFIPFITEELWGHLKRAIETSPAPLPPSSPTPSLPRSPAPLPPSSPAPQLPSSLAPHLSDALIIAPWPEPTALEDWETESLASFALVQEAVRAIRNLRAEKGVRPGQLIPAIFVAEGEAANLLEGQLPIVAALASLDPAQTAVLPSFAGEREGYVSLVVGAGEIFLPLSGLVNVAEERARLSKELAEAEAQINRLETLLTGPFAQKAPAPVVQKERDRLAAYRETADKLRGQLHGLG